MARSAYTLADFARFCRSLVLDNGKALKLEPFQRALLSDHFAGIPQTVIVIPKGNGKTTLLSALAIYHLLRTEDARVIIAAASREQAGILLDQARGIIRRSGLDADLRPHLREIRRADGRGDIRVIASDVDNADGLIFTLGLIDELHRHRKSDLYGIFRDGLDKRAGQMVTISTAGAQAESPLGHLRSHAHRLPTFERSGVHNYARSDSLAWHEWALTDEDDLRNLRLVKQANPASWQTMTRLRRRRDDPSTTPAQWARFACGVWTEGENPWIEPHAWDSLAVDIGGLAPGDDVIVAVRAGAGVGIGLASPRDDGAVAGGVIVLPPPPGGRVPLEAAERTLLEVAERYRVREIGYDPDQFQRSAEMLDAAGLPMVEVPQRGPRLAAASATFWRLVSSGKLRHDGNPTLRAQVLAGVTKESLQGWRLEPTPQTSGLVALVIACHECTKVPDEPPAFVAL